MFLRFGCAWLLYSYPIFHQLAQSGPCLKIPALDPHQISPPHTCREQGRPALHPHHIKPQSIAVPSCCNHAFFNPQPFLTTCSHTATEFRALCLNEALNTKSYQPNSRAICLCSNIQTLAVGKAEQPNYLSNHKRTNLLYCFHRERGFPPCSSSFLELPL